MAADLWTLYWAFVAFVFGAVTGSFLNVCIWRLPQNQSLSDPPSHCPKCEHRLAFFPDMVPMLSQLWYRSRCRYCGERFSWRYLGVELLTALAFTAVYYRYVVFAPPTFGEVDANWSALAGMIFVAALVTIFFIDLDTYTIPDAAVMLAVLVAVAKDVYLIAHGHRPLLQAIPGTPWSVPLPLSVLGCVLAFWALWQFSALATALLGKEAMGGGDSMLLAAMASFLIPWPLVVIAFIIAVGLGTIGGLIGMWLADREEPAAAPERPEASAPPPDVATDSAMPDLLLLDSAETQADETLAGQRGVVEIPGATPEGEPSAPQLPASSRWGRLWTVLGTWVAVGGLWLALVTAVDSPTRGIGIGVASAVAATLLLRFGIRQWTSNEKAWAEQMDVFFEGDPGPRFIPFGPYLVAGTFLAMMFGQRLVLWYAVGQLGLSPEAVGRLPWD